MRSVWCVLLLASVALAGCTSGENAEPVTSAECLEQGLILGTDEVTGEPTCVEPPFVIQTFENPEHDCVVNKDRDRVHAPDLLGEPWIIGQSWAYDLEVDGVTSETKLIYYADQDVGGNLPLHYMVGTPTRDEALVQAIDSVNPVIGRVHSVLYSPHESGDHANMFNFPLCQGSSWETVFYGETFALTADRPTEAAAFFITGTSSEGSTLRIDYDADVQWFTLIDLDRADGQTVTMTLKETGSGATGEAFFLRGQKDFRGELSVESPVQNVAVAQEIVPFDREDGGDGPYNTVGFHLVADISGQGVATLAINFPDGTIASETYQLDGTPVNVDDYFEHPFQAGTWSVELDLIGASPDGMVGNVVFDAVSIYDRSCTVGGNCLA